MILSISSPQSAELTTNRRKRPIINHLNIVTMRYALLILAATAAALPTVRISPY